MAFRKRFKRRGFKKGFRKSRGRRSKSIRSYATATRGGIRL